MRRFGECQKECNVMCYHCSRLYHSTSAITAAFAAAVAVVAVPVALFPTTTTRGVLFLAAGFLFIRLLCGLFSARLFFSATIPAGRSTTWRKSQRRQQREQNEKKALHENEFESANITKRRKSVCPGKFPGPPGIISLAGVSQMSHY